MNIHTDLKSLSTPGWNEERVDLLKKMWADGSSLSEIMLAIGGGLTRNAVAGKVHRLGLKKRGGHGLGGNFNVKPVRPKPVKKGSDQITGSAINRLVRKRKRARINAESGLCDVIEVCDVEPNVDDLAIPFEQRKTLLDLTDDTCRWGVGDPQSTDFFFCGGRVAETVVNGKIRKQSYCAHHCNIAYQPRREPGKISDTHIAFLNGEYRRKAA